LIFRIGLKYILCQFWHLYHCTGPQANAGLVAWFSSRHLSSELLLHFCFFHFLFAKPFAEGGGLRGMGQIQAQSHQSLSVPMWLVIKLNQKEGAK
jgi:hypothetical protein